MRLKILIIAWLALTVGCVAFSFITSCHPLASKPFSSDPQDICVLGNDFELRMNEIECLRSGIDPFLVWHGDINHDKYYPFRDVKQKTAERNNPINAYTPWEYTYLLPIEILGHNTAWWIFLCLQFTALLFMAGFAFRFGAAHGGRIYGLMAVAVVLSPALAIWSDVRSGNFAIIITALAMLLMHLLKHNHDILAGVTYALMMTKPQLCLLFVIPLLFLKKFKTLTVAAGVCLIATIPPCLMASRSPITLILESPKAGADGFTGCILVPTIVVNVLGEIGLPAVTGMLVAMIIGFSLWLFFTYRLRACKRLYWVFAPAIFFSVAWTYNQWHSYCLYALLALPLCEMFLLDPRKHIKLLAMGAMFCCMMGGFYVAKAFEVGLPRFGINFPLQAVYVTRALFDVLSVIGICAIFKFGRIMHPSPRWKSANPTFTGLSLSDMHSRSLAVPPRARKLYGARDRLVPCG